MSDLKIQLKNKKLIASYERHVLKFKVPAKTSREIFKEKETYLLKIYYEDNSSIGFGECSPLWSLSIDPKASYESKLSHVCKNINDWQVLLKNLTNYPSILTGLETALLDLTNGGKGIIFPSRFTDMKSKLKINGLIWMGDFQSMSQQIEKKIEEGFSCVKLKIGAINWQDEIALLKGIRNRFSAQDIEIRVDANGAFEYDSALNKLDQLHKLQIHSIEQPIKQGQINKMATLCEKSEIPIALDEELIGIQPLSKMEEIIRHINPHFLVLKPTLLGGFKATTRIISIADSNNTSWWITSALEGNIGLNAITQFTATTENKLPQGLGTGNLYVNNLPSQLRLEKDNLSFLKINA